MPGTAARPRMGANLGARARKKRFVEWPPGHYSWGWIDARPLAPGRGLRGAGAGLRRARRSSLAALPRAPGGAGYGRGWPALADRETADPRERRHLQRLR